MQILRASCRVAALIFNHDLSLGSDFHVVTAVAQGIAVAGPLLFLRHGDRNDTHLRETLAAYE